MLHQAILELAPPHNADERAPQTFRELRACGAGRVWCGESSNTIWLDPRINHAFRAWHDEIHLRLDADFSLQGELRCAREHIRELRDRWPRIDAKALQLIWLETAGQAMFYDATGHFPQDQRKWINEQLSGY